MSKSTWVLITKRALLLQSGHCNQAAAGRMKREIHTALKADKQQLTADVGERIVAKLGAGNVKEAFRHLKGWYCAASETQAEPCPQTVEHQTDERVALYARLEAYGERFPANGTPLDIRDNNPTEGEIRCL